MKKNITLILAMFYITAVPCQGEVKLLMSGIGGYNRTSNRFRYVPAFGIASENKVSRNFYIEGGAFLFFLPRIYLQGKYAFLEKEEYKLKIGL